MDPRTALVAALAGLTLLVPAGCEGGEGEDESASEGASLTAAEYRKQGVALCKEALRKVERIPVPSSEDKVADYLDQVFDASQGVTDEFEKLNPPEELRADHEQAVELSRESEKKSDAFVDRVRESDDPRAAALREFRKFAPEIKRSEQLNEKLGLEECNEVGPAPEQPGTS
jgi:hypothetical protein